MHKSLPFLMTAFISQMAFAQELSPLTEKYELRVAHQAGLKVLAAKGISGLTVKAKLTYDNSVIKCHLTGEDVAQTDFTLSGSNQSVSCESLIASEKFVSSIVNVTLSTERASVDSSEVIDLADVQTYEKALKNAEADNMDRETFAVLKRHMQTSLPDGISNEEKVFFTSNEPKEASWFVVDRLNFNQGSLSSYAVGLKVEDKVKNKHILYPEFPYHAWICKNRDEVFQPKVGMLIRIKGILSCFPNTNRPSKKLFKEESRGFGNVGFIYLNSLWHSWNNLVLKDALESKKNSASEQAKKAAFEKEKLENSKRQLALAGVGNSLKQVAEAASSAFRKSIVAAQLNSLAQEYKNKLSSYGFPEKIQARPVFKKYKLLQNVVSIDSSKGVKEYYDLEIISVSKKYSVTTDTAVEVADTAFDLSVPTKERVPAPPKVKSSDGKVVDGERKSIPERTIFVCAQNVDKFEKRIKNTIDKVPPYPTVGAVFSDLNQLTVRSVNECAPLVDQSSEAVLVRGEVKAWMVASRYESVDGRDSVYRVQYSQKGLSVEYHGNVVGSATMTKSVRFQDLPEYLQKNEIKTDLLFSELTKEDRYRIETLETIRAIFEKTVSSLSIEDRKELSQEPWFIEYDTSTQWYCQISLNTGCNGYRHSTKLDQHYFSESEAIAACKEYAKREGETPCAVKSLASGAKPVLIKK